MPVLSGATMLDEKLDELAEYADGVGDEAGAEYDPVPIGATTELDDDDAETGAEL